MAKKGPIGKAESFYIEEKYKSGETVEDIAQALDRSQNSIEEYINSNNIKVSRTIVDQQFARQKGAVIMTENASTMIDASKKQVRSINSNCISKIK
jgi:hypothetical protein